MYNHAGSGPDGIVCGLSNATSSSPGASRKGLSLPLLIAADLARRGFRVSAESASTSTGPDERRLRLIDDAPDFILVLTTGDLDGCGDPADSMRREIARALETNRNIVRVTVSPAVSSIDSPFPPGLEALAASQTITYDPARGKESLALLSHRLSSDAAVDERGVMRRARRIFAAAALAIVAILAIEGVPVLLRNLAGGPEARPLPPLAVYWSIFGQRQGPDGWSAFAVAEGSPVVAGDQVRLVFSPSADGCAYVLARDARKDVSVLFPTQALRAASRVRAGERYSAPVETDWLTVEEGAGLEAIYLFASYNPIENLEELVEERDGRFPSRPALPWWRRPSRGCSTDGTAPRPDAFSRGAAGQSWAASASDRGPPFSRRRCPTAPSSPTGRRSSRASSVPWWRSRSAPGDHDRVGPSTLGTGGLSHNRPDARWFQDFRSWARRA